MGSLGDGAYRGNVDVPRGDRHFFGFLVLHHTPLTEAPHPLLSLASSRPGHLDGLYI